MPTAEAWNRYEGIAGIPASFVNSGKSRVLLWRASWSERWS